MLRRIFPKQFDNNFRGNRLAIWLLAVIVLIRLAIGMNSIINTRLVAISADGIPLDRFNAGGAEAVVALFALLGLFTLLFALQGVVVLIRYRAMIPFIYLVLLIQQIGGKALALIHPIASSGAPSVQNGSGFILAVQAMTLIGFALSLLNADSPGQDNPIRVPRS
jgi:hypothetical protein